MTGPRQRATIYDLAKAAKTSSSTVSLVMSGRWQDYRIRPETAERVLAAAGRLGYTANLKARSLRLKRSGLAGMIVPHYRNRFFAGLTEHFEIEARRRGLCPIVVSTQRDPATELSSVASLVAHEVEFLFVAGVRDPRAANRLCREASIPSINIDLPGTEAPSAISDNRVAAEEMTRELIAKLPGRSDFDFLFFGGDALDNSTIERMEGVRRAFAGAGLPVRDDAFNYCGYRPPEIAEALKAEFARRDGRMPDAIFANGITALEGLFLAVPGVGLGELSHKAIACYDWDPFAGNLPMNIIFARQDVEGLIAAGFRLLDDEENFQVGRNPTVRVKAGIRYGRSA